MQSQRDEEFPERMFVMNYRLYDRYRRPVVSLAVLADEQPGWRQSRFGYSLGGSSMGIEFPVVKLLDYEQDLSVLETEANPFAPVVLAVGRRTCCGRGSRPGAALSCKLDCFLPARVCAGHLAEV